MPIKKTIDIRMDIKNISKNDYPDKYILAIEQAKTREDKRAIINRVYDDGFGDGYTAGIDDLNS